MHSLSEAVDLDHALVMKEVEKDDPVFKEFKKTPEFQKWSIAMSLFKPIKDSKGFIKNHPYWLPSSNEGDDWNIAYEFKANGDLFKGRVDEPGAKVAQYRFEKDGSVLLDQKKYVLKPIKIYFDSGKNFFFVAALVGDENYILGPKSSSQCDDHFNY